MDQQSKLLHDQCVALLKEYMKQCQCWWAGWGPCRTCQKLLNLELPGIGLPGIKESETEINGGSKHDEVDEH